jgi:integrase
MSPHFSDRPKRVVVWVQHRGDRPYLDLQWYDPVTRRRRCKSAETCNPLDAEQKRADLEYELNHGFYRDAARLSWEAFRPLFEAEYLPGKRPRTRKKYQEVFNLFEELCRPARLASVNERALSAFLSGMRSRKVRGRVGMGAATMKVYLEYLHTALKWAARQKLLPECPAFPPVKVPRKNPQPVPVEAFERLLAKAPDEHWRALLWTGWLAGLRVGECYALQWQENDQAPWPDFGRNRIILPAAFVKADADQWVPLATQLRNILEALPRTGPKVFALRARDGHRLALTTVSDYIIGMARRAGVKLSAHSLRKGFGCRYAGKVPAQVLQRLMRHANIATTMAYYANIDDAVEEAVRREEEVHVRGRTAQPAEEGGRT